MQLVALGSNTTCSNPCAQTDTYVSGLHTLFTGMDARIGVDELFCKPLTGRAQPVAGATPFEVFTRNNWRWPL